MGSVVYGVMAVAALGTLVWRHPLSDAAQKAAAPLGAGFSIICLAAGVTRMTGKRHRIPYSVSPYYPPPIEAQSSVSR